MIDLAPPCLNSRSTITRGLANSFPEADLMTDIIKVHFPEIEKNLVSHCLRRFYWLREQDNIRKKPSTSELVDWIGALARAGISPKTLEKELPFVGVLLKKEQDLAAFENKFAKPRNRFI